MAVRPFCPWTDRLDRAGLLHLFGMSREGLQLARVARAKGVPVVLSPICWIEPRAMAALATDPVGRLANRAKWRLKALAPRFPTWRRDLLRVGRRDPAQLGRRGGAARPLVRGRPEQDPARAQRRRGAVRPRRPLGLPRDPRPGRLRPLRRPDRAEEERPRPGRRRPRRRPAAGRHRRRPAGLRGVRRRLQAGRGGFARWLPRVDHDDPILESAYAAARVLALPSWFETPGLVALEAALAGTAVVVTPHGCTREYFGDRVGYARPDRPEEIARRSRRPGASGPDPGSRRTSGRITPGRRWPGGRRRLMNRSPAKAPRPVATGRYRYTKWRWRIAVRVLDAVGSILIRLWRLARPEVAVPAPRKILVVQLDHMGDAILTTPIFPRLRAAYPGAMIEVLASPSNREVFEADPDVDRVHLADRNWFERRPGRRALGSAVWTLGRTLRRGGYDLGIDVRGDILTVLVLALAGIPRRLGWAMGGGGFLLTDVARWVPGRHEVDSRLACWNAWGSPRIRPRTSGSTRPIATGSGSPSGSATPGRAGARRRQVAAGPALMARAGQGGIEPASALEPARAGRLGRAGLAPRRPVRRLRAPPGGPPRRRGRGEALADAALAGPGRPVPRGRLAGDRRRRARGRRRRGGPRTGHPGLRDWTGQLALSETAALLERADLFIGSDSGPAHLAASAAIPSVILFSGTNRPRQWRPWSRRALVLRAKVPCRPCHHKVLPPRRSPLHDRPRPRPRPPGRPPLVGPPERHPRVPDLRLPCSKWVRSVAAIWLRGGTGDNGFVIVVCKVGSFSSFAKWVRSRRRAKLGSFRVSPDHCGKSEDHGGSESVGAVGLARRTRMARQSSPFDIQETLGAVNTLSAMRRRIRLGLGCTRTGPAWCRGTRPTTFEVAIARGCGGYTPRSDDCRP